MGDDYGKTNAFKVYTDTKGVLFLATKSAKGREDWVRVLQAASAACVHCAGTLKLREGSKMKPHHFLLNGVHLMYFKKATLDKEKGTAGKKLGDLLMRGATVTEMDPGSGQKYSLTVSTASKTLELQVP